MTGHYGADHYKREDDFGNDPDYKVGGTTGGKKKVKENTAKKEGGEEGIKEDAAKKEGGKEEPKGYLATRAARSDVNRDWVKKKATSSSGSDEPLKSNEIVMDEGIHEDYEKHLASKPVKLKALTSKQGDREAGAK